MTVVVGSIVVVTGIVIGITVVVGIVDMTGEMHTPFWHVCPTEHAIPQLPQLMLSYCKFRHAPLQRLWSEGQGGFVVYTENGVGV